jgi:endonuclease/exonuclease/phosphatase family metal-dependent hydrolase
MHYSLIDDKAVAHSAIVQYIIDADPDVVGLSEVTTHPLYQDLKSSMSSLGYLDHSETTSSQASCSAIFYKRAKLACVETQLLQLDPASSQSTSEHFLMYLRLQSSQDARH